MKTPKLIIPLLLVLSVFGCGKPVPPEKSAYVGEWHGSSMDLVITQEGAVRYKRVNGSVSTKVEGPLKGFTGDNFEVGVGPMSTTFVVGKPPYENGGSWKMVVDGVELTRSAQ